MRHILILIVLTVLNTTLVGASEILPVNERTEQVRNAIVTATTEANTAEQVTNEHLTKITTLNLRNKEITELKSGDFSGLTGLTSLNLYGNKLSILPDNIFKGLTSLNSLRLGGNTVDPFSLTISIQKVVEDQFKIGIPTGAPFKIVVQVNVVNGTFGDNATTAAIPKGSIESNSVSVTPTAGTTDAITANLDTLPTIPRNHFGYALTKSDVMSIEIAAAIQIDSEPTENSAPEFTEGDNATRSRATYWDGRNNIGERVATGLYICAFKAGNYSAIRKMLIRK
ncbi:leucine-rich repeat domain-containing protein [Candidatus Poribacteria bacterium]|nr:leucine-rich repeat domain-containing protein [Candidatus Poribacteria bacterium]